MKRTILGFLFLLMNYASVAQINIDSLWSIWTDTSQADTIRLLALEDLIWDSYLYTQPDSAFYYAQIQYDFSESKGLKKWMARASRMQGTSFRVKGEYSKAIEYLQNGLVLSEEIGDKKGIASSFTKIGSLLNRQGQANSALNHFQKSLKIYEEIGHTEGISAVLNNIGGLYGAQGDFPRAIEYLQKSLTINDELGDEVGKANTLINIGIIYRHQEEWSLAFDYHQRSIKIREKIGDKIGIARSLIAVGNIYMDQEDHLKAMDYFQKSLKSMEEIGYTDKTIILNNIGNVYLEKEEYKMALKYYNKSLKLIEEIGKRNLKPVVHNNLGRVYQNQNLYSSAISECQQSLQLAQELGIVLEEKKANDCLYAAYKALGNGMKALEYHEQILLITENLKAEDTGKKLQQMEFQKQILADSLVQEEEKIQVQMAHEKVIRKKNRNQGIALSAGIIFLLLAASLYNRMLHIRKSRAALQIEKDRSENLLLNILPAEIAEELKIKGKADAREFDIASILFTDFKDFTQTSEKLSSKELVEEINVCFKAFDATCEKYQIEKIKTIGDAYMAAGGLPVSSEGATKNTVLAALEMQDFIKKRKAKNDSLGQTAFQMRVGVHTGPVVAGIVGVKKFQYDIWGDTVNIASRIESNGAVGKVNISQTTFNLLKSDLEFQFDSRGKIEVKGKGALEMYFVEKKFS